MPAGCEAERIEPSWRGRGPLPPPEDPIREALSRPLGRAAGAALPAGAEILLVVPDATRQAHLPRVLPALFEELERVGVERGRIQLAIAGGVHRPLSAERARELVGAEAARRVLHVHDADSTPHFVAGRTRRGTPVELDDALREAEAVITVGPVAPHYFAGFGGGPKLVFPGLASRRSTLANHALSLSPLGDDRPLHPGCLPGQVEGNPVAEDLREAAAQAPVDFELGLVEDEGMVAAWAGPAPLAQRAAEDFLRLHASAGEPGAFDLVVASAGGDPHDVNWIQAHKALAHACSYARPGAAVVLVAACPGGVGSPSFEEVMALPEASAARAVRERFTLNGQTALSTRWHARRYRVILVSGLPPEQVRAWGMEVGSDLGAALRMAAPARGTRVALCPKAAAVMPARSDGARPAERGPR